MRYQMQPGESPAMIARRYGVSFDALIRANPRKATKVVNGVTTWAEVLPREEIIVPVGGLIGDALTDAIVALGGSPCDQANVGLVCEVQRLLGVTVDGKYGSGTASAARAKFPGAPPACSPRPSWWAPPGQSNCPTTTTARTPLPSGPAANATTAAVAALAALQADPNYCTSVKRAGTAVNTAIHNFKAAWNAANPTNTVPINTGNYEPIVQIAIALALNVAQENIPPGCGAAPVIAPTPAPAPAPVPGPTNVVIAPTSAPAAVQALLGINPCDPSSVSVVCAAQRALGVTVDGKYGSGTAGAAARVLPGAPPACSPRPSWWAPAGQSNCPGAAPPPPAPVPGPVPPPPPPPPVPTPSGVPAAVQALTTFNPCDQMNVERVRDAQRVLGVTVDGKYGTNTAAAARRVVSNAPAACSPAPAWWGARGVPAPPPPPGPTPGPAPGPTPIVVVPEKKGLSTGAIVAGAIGAAALVGLIAVAATGKKGHRGARGPRGRRGGHKKRKSSHHRARRRH